MVSIVTPVRAESTPMVSRRSTLMVGSQTELARKARVVPPANTTTKVNFTNEAKKSGRRSDSGWRPNCQLAVRCGVVCELITHTTTTTTVSPLFLLLLLPKLTTSRRFLEAPRNRALVAGARGLRLGTISLGSMDHLHRIQKF